MHAFDSRDGTGITQPHPCQPGLGWGLSCGVDPIGKTIPHRYPVGIVIGCPCPGLGHTQDQQEAIFKDQTIHLTSSVLSLSKKNAVPAKIAKTIAIKPKA